MIAYLSMANTVIEVRKNPNENNSSVLRRFLVEFRVGIIRRVKGSRYNLRKRIKTQKVKNSALTNDPQKRNRMLETRQDSDKVGYARRGKRK